MSKSQKESYLKTNRRAKYEHFFTPYWIKKGFTEEALIKLNKEQSTFSKQKCIEKYGEEKGIEIWKKRQDKWQQTLNSKSKEFLYE